jgi:hypothetical protein
MVHMPSGQLLVPFFPDRSSELLLSFHSLICPHCHLYQTTQMPGAVTSLGTISNTSHIRLQLPQWYENRHKNLEDGQTLSTILKTA